MLFHFMRNSVSCSDRTLRRQKVLLIPGDHVDPLLKGFSVDGARGAGDSVAVGIDKISGGKRIYAVGDSRAVIGIILDREGKSLFVHITSGRFEGLPGTVGHVDHQEMDVFAQLGIGLVEIGHFALAGTAPARPEIHDHRLSAEV